METEAPKNNSIVDIALIQKDIQFITATLTRIEASTSNYDKIYARREELTDAIKSIEKVHSDISKSLDEKVDQKTFAPFERTLSRVNWLIISLFVTALAGLVFVGANYLTK